MKVTSDRIKARASQLRSQGFKLSGNMVRRTLELNAGVRTQLSSKEKEATAAEEVSEHVVTGPKNIEAA
jgi:non-ribosomal peptide synthetase component E (peptide arylation enzyme)